MRTYDITTDLAPSVLYDLESRDIKYNPETGALRYGMRATPKRAGKLAGSLGINGGRYITSMGIYKFRGADVAWLLYHRRAPNLRVVCLNGQAGDLCLSNLRETHGPMQTGRRTTLDAMGARLPPPEVVMAIQKAREHLAVEQAAGGADALFMSRLKVKLAALKRQQARAQQAVDLGITLAELDALEVRCEALGVPVWDDLNPLHPLCPYGVNPDPLPDLW